MKFEICTTESPLCGDLIYRQSEYSIDFICKSSEQLRQRTGEKASTSLIVTTLQLEVGIESRTLLYPWGFFPLSNIESKSLTIPIAIAGSVRIETHAINLIKGVSVEIPNTNTWEVAQIINSDYIYLGPSNPSSENSVYVEISSNSIIGISNGYIASIFLRPRVVE